MLNRAGITWGYSVPKSGVHVEFFNRERMSLQRLALGFE